MGGQGDDGHRLGKVSALAVGWGQAQVGEGRWAPLVPALWSVTVPRSLPSPFHTELGPLSRGGSLGLGD